MSSHTHITVLYPNESDATFNLDYYLTSYMPMVAHEFGPYGFEGYTVLKLLGTPGERERPCCFCPSSPPCPP
jgi:hypothetical protein